MIDLKELFGEFYGRGAGYSPRKDADEKLDFIHPEGWSAHLERRHDVVTLDYDGGFAFKAYGNAVEAKKRFDGIVKKLESYGFEERSE